MRLLERRAWTWLSTALLAAGLGLWAGGLEAVELAARLALDLSFGEALLLVGASLLSGALVAALSGAAAGLLLQLPGRMDGVERRSRALGLATLALAGFYFAPVAWALHRQERELASLAALLLPVGFAGTAYLNARYWLRRAELGLVPRLPWLVLSGLGAGLLGLACAFALSHRREPGAERALEGDPDVVLVTIDTLRRDHVSIYGEPEAVPTPRFDAFAEQGVLYLDAVTPMPETTPAHASMLTGLHPLQHGVLSNGHYLSSGFETLAERLRDEGYATGAFVSSFALDSRTGLAQGFQVYDDDFFSPVPGLSEIRLVGLALKLVMRFGDPLDFPFLLERSAPETNRRAIRWMRKQREAHRPFFCWVHYFEPHAPYEPHPEGPGAVQPRVDHRAILADEAHFTYTPEVEDALRELYGGEVTYVDAQLGVLLDALHELGMDDEALVIVTADHGEMLGEHGYRFNHHSIYEPAVRVPLAIRAPRFHGPFAPVDAQVRLTDLSTTVLAYLRMDPLPHSEGTDLLAYARRLRHRSLAAFLTGRKQASLRRGSLYGLRTGGGRADTGAHVKYILDEDDGHEELYDLDADPGEEHDISAEQPEAVAHSRELVQRLRVSAVGREHESGQDDATLNALRALGYVE